ncbi:hypothetical protein Q9L58_009470 [Maublancomyces gigas]|uniref:Uncharacterized protein n=1 Tax=Discina gigas TaxID=1032678 RepID=A0ABR3G761_9PEZI
MVSERASRLPASFHEDTGMSIATVTRPLFHLDQQFLDDPRRPIDQLSRWHLRQAVLANMRGAGEPVFKIDFPPGSNMVGEIISGPRARLVVT